MLTSDGCDFALDPQMDEENGFRKTQSVIRGLRV